MAESTVGGKAVSTSLAASMTCFSGRMKEQGGTVGDPCFHVFEFFLPLSAQSFYSTKAVFITFVFLEQQQVRASCLIE